MKFCYQLIISITKFVILRLFSNQNTRNFESFFASSEKKPFKRMHVMVRTVHYLDMTCTVLLHCPISAEIRTVDSQ